MIAGVIAQQAALLGGGGVPAPVVVTEDQFYYNVALQIDATGESDGTGYVSDQSRHAHALTYGGSGAIASEFFEFNGTTDYIQAPYRALWIPGSRITWEFFGVQFDAGSGTDVLASHYEGDGGRDWIIQYNWSTNELQLLAYTSTGDGTPDTLAISWTPSTSTEYDIAIMWDGASLRAYIDGLYVGKIAYAGPWGLATQELIVGADDGPGGGIRNFFDGRMRAFRITRGIDRAAASETHYARHAIPLCTAQSTTTDPDWDNVVLLVSGGSDGSTIRDESPYDWPMTKSGTVSVDTVNVALSGVNSVAFTGADNSDPIILQHDPLLALATKDYTIELFARHTSISSGTNLDKTYLAKYAASANQREWAFWYHSNRTPDGLRTFCLNSGGLDYQTNFVATVNQFYHIATTRNGNDKRNFVDGVQVGSTLTSANDFTPTSSQRLAIGQLGESDKNNFAGQMSEIRVTVGACRYAAGFSPPAAAFPRG